VLGFSFPQNLVSPIHTPLRHLDPFTLLVKPSDMKEHPNHNLAFIPTPKLIHLGQSQPLKLPCFHSYHVSKKSPLVIKVHTQPTVSSCGPFINPHGPLSLPHISFSFPCSLSSHCLRLAARRVWCGLRCAKAQCVRVSRA
jgi:hypothetical protein